MHLSYCFPFFFLVFLISVCGLLTDCVYANLPAPAQGERIAGILWCKTAPLKNLGLPAPLAGKKRLFRSVPRHRTYGQAAARFSRHSNRNAGGAVGSYTVLQDGSGAEAEFARFRPLGGINAPVLGQKVTVFSVTCRRDNRRIRKAEERRLREAKTIRFFS